MNLQWNQITAALIIGVGLGAIAGNSPYIHDAVRKLDNRPPHVRMLERFAKRLDLTAEQKSQVSTIMEQKRARMNAVFNDMKPQFAQVRTETSDEIRKILTPEQQKKFAVMESKMSERFNKRFPPHS
jgi:Spy/CpxP family protein refolding chaperone